MACFQIGKSRNYTVQQGWARNNVFASWQRFRNNVNASTVSVTSNKKDKIIEAQGVKTELLQHLLYI